jgi:hypothetical protein
MNKLGTSTKKSIQKRYDELKKKREDLLTYNSIFEKGVELDPK